jgi:hypothetical protein
MGTNEREILDVLESIRKELKETTGMLCLTQQTIAKLSSYIRNDVIRADIARSLGIRVTPMTV